MSQLLGVGVLATACLFATTCLFGAEPSVQELTDGLHRRIIEFRNLEFEYKVDATFEAGPEMQYDASGNPTDTKPGTGPPKIVKSQDVFRILDSNRPDMDRPWRFWKQSIEEEGKWVVKEILTYDGQHTSFYIRRESGSKNDFSTGAIIPFESIQYYDENIFDRFLCTDHNGLSEYMDIGWKLSRGMEHHWKVDGTVDFEGQAAYVLRGHNPYVEHLLHIIGFPHFLVIRRVVSPKGKPDAEALMRWDVTSVAEFNGRLYPSSGTFHQSSAPGQPKIDYEFHVTAVKSLDDSAREHWCPEWLSGTVVRDQVNNRNITVPYAAGEHEAVMAQRSRINRQLPQSPPSSRSFLFLMIINVTGICIVIAWWAVSRIQRARNSSRPGK